MGTVGDELVVSARVGDEDAWAALYRAHAGRLLVWLRASAGAATAEVTASAEDVAAEAWLTAARRIGSFEGDDDAFAGWLFGIARNVAANGRRSRTRRATDPHAVEPGDEAFWGTDGDHASVVAGESEVRSLLARLPRREAEVVACLDVVGLDVASTAQALQLSPTAVRVAHHRGLKKLRAHLAPRTAEHLAEHRTQPATTNTLVRPLENPLESAFDGPTVQAAET